MHSCTRCGMIFAQAQGLTRHMARKFPCIERGDTLIRATGNLCTECGQAYSTAGNLERHKKKVCSRKLNAAAPIAAAPIVLDPLVEMQTRIALLERIIEEQKQQPIANYAGGSGNSTNGNMIVNNIGGTVANTVVNHITIAPWGGPLQLTDAKVEAALAGTPHPAGTPALQYKQHGGGRRCTEAACTKSAVGKSDKCVEHGGGRRCTECITWTDSHCGQKQYEMGGDWYCARCFKRKFPEDPRSAVIYEHTKEIAVRNALAAHFEGFIHDRPLYTANCDCTHRRRIDHRKLIGNTILAIETDEWGHRGYDEKDEEIRYHDLYMLHSGKWVFIRFNPDVMGVRQEPLAERLERLIGEVALQTGRIEREENVELLEVVKLYY